jgi:hypothetical protein
MRNNDVAIGGGGQSGLAIRANFGETAPQAGNGCMLCWLTQKVAAWRKRRAQLRNLEYLRILDREILADMGIAGEILGENPASLWTLDPHVVATGFAAGFTVRPAAPRRH